MDQNTAVSSFKHHSMTEGTIATKTFTWAELMKGCCSPPYKGDCHQVEGTLVIQSDGKAHFSCVTWTVSTHSGDNWKVGFALQDHSGVTLFNSPMHTGPRMDDGHPPPRYRWGFDFTFDPGIYDNIIQLKSA